MIKKQTIIIFLLFIIATAISWPLYFYNYAAPDTVKIHEFPMTIGDWTAEELPISDNDYEILETRNAFARMYTHKNGGQVMLYMIYSQHNRRVAHPPEICYTGGGATIITKYPYTITYDNKKDLTVNRVIIDEVNYQQIMYYWFKIGNSYTPSYGRQQLLIGIKTLMGKPSSSALIRMTTVLKDDNDEKNATQLINSFAQDILPIIPQYLP
jgi:EpsI family protein